MSDVIDPTKAQVPDSTDASTERENRAFADFTAELDSLVRGCNDRLTALSVATDENRDELLHDYNEIEQEIRNLVIEANSILSETDASRFRNRVERLIREMNVARNIDADRGRFGEKVTRATEDMLGAIVGPTNVVLRKGADLGIGAVGSVSRFATHGLAEVVLAIRSGAQHFFSKL